MRHYLIINASPRVKSTSMLLANMCKVYLEEHEKKVTLVSLHKNGGIDATVDAIKGADVVVISGPCYVNTYPAAVIKLLTEWEKRALDGQTVYGMIQGGMPYPHTHKSGLNMLEVFAAKNGLGYKGGFICGVGPMINGDTLDRLPNAKKLKRQLDVFFANVRDEKQSEDAVYEQAQMPMPTLLARILAIFMNRSINKKYAALGWDARQESPYKHDALDASL